MGGMRRARYGRQRQGQRGARLLTALPLPSSARSGSNLRSGSRSGSPPQSEFQQAKQSDSTRRAQLLAHLAAPSHPYHRFGWGNRK